MSRAKANCTPGLSTINVPARSGSWVFTKATAAITALAIVQIAMGSMIFLVIPLWVIGVLSAAFLLRKVTTIADVFVFFFGIYMSYAPFMIKTALGQTLQTNLVRPFESGVYLLFSFLSIASAAFLANHFTQGYRSRLSQQVQKIGLNSHLLLPILLIGLSTRILFVLIVKVETATSGSGGGGILSLFLPILHLGIAMAAYHSSRGNFTGKIAIIAVIIISFALVVVSNQKKELVLLALPIIFTIFAFRIRVRLRFLLPSIFLGYVMVALVVPAIQILRPDIGGTSVTKRVEMFWDIIAESKFSPEKLAFLQSEHFSAFTYSYGPNLSYVFPSTANVDRFMLLFPTDQVVRTLDQPSSVDVDDALQSLSSTVLPSFLVSKMPADITDIVAWDRQIRGNKAIARPVLGLPAMSVALGGPWGSLIIPFFIMLPFLTMANYLFGTLQDGFFAVVGCSMLIANVEVGPNGYLFFVFREFFLVWILFSLLNLASRAIVLKVSTAHGYKPRTDADRRIPLSAYQKVKKLE